MPAINRSALVMHSAADMFKLINDIPSYPQFLPGCRDAKVISQDDNSMTASLLVSKAGVEKWFTTKNELTENQRVSMNLLDGPFKQLSGDWIITPLSDTACKVTLQLEYEFSSKLIELAIGKVFNTLTNNMVAAFTQRAKEVY
ncbi:type II toxin-antitoxin system RatA family toxin [Thalassotalea mangrovi]|uniref:Type II toxin-antitoxin system RatA family toxin n=1 Tax=Thalassotalea mangrovi TaxID=2572245 RepID=A0A4V5NU60_9GAMM|nr:type II toxin-antitoxin system RatA family toxin [Thalassotalea mangrovi]TKB44701.1 type II toxin-antitoxin system RatA family toxin [Thalassotalea mangrovi]